MELLVATWTLRVAIAAALAVGGVSISVGTPVIDSIDRAMAAAVAFTFAGRWLAGWLEPPEARLLRMRRRRDARRAKGTKTGARRAPNRASESTISRTA